MNCRPPPMSAHALVQLQQARRVAENARALNRLNQLSAQVALYQALGGPT